MTENNFSNETVITEEKKNNITDFQNMLLLLLARKAGFAVTKNGSALIRREMGAATVLRIHVLNDSSREKIRDYMEGFLSRNATGTVGPGVQHRFVHIAEDFGKYREDILPLLREYKEKCSEMMVYTEFDILDLRTGKAFSCDSEEISDRKLRNIYAEALANFENSSEKVAEEKKIIRDNAKARTEELRKRRVPFMNISTILIIINVAVFLAEQMLQLNYRIDPIYEIGVQQNLAVAEGEWWRLFTAMFLHADVSHILGNMVMLFFLGRVVLTYYNTFEFSVIYFAGGLLGNILSQLFMPEYTVSLGASGAIMALGGVLIYRMFFGKYKKDFRRTRYYIVIAVSILYNLVYGLLQPDVDNWGHFGGFAFGFASGFIIYLIKKARRRRKNRNGI